jgi:uncharacterized 2Fe-2S/4Fe-4S cluster protein (DUF4445 family)
MSSEIVRIQLEPLSVVVEVPPGEPLLTSISQFGFEFPCGGSGLCGGCRVRLLAGSLLATDQDRSAFSTEELAHGWRLACQAHVETPIVLECGQWCMDVLADHFALPAVRAGTEKHGLGIAIDLGTTTIAAQMLDLATANILAVETDLNPQAAYGSDVMTRICAALTGNDLTTVVRSKLQTMIAKLTRGREPEICEIVLVGNTVMHHLFARLDVAPLSCAPFESAHLEEQSFRPEELGWPLRSECRIRFLRCLGGFVGSDILAGIVAVGMPSADNLTALVDLGTNGEIVIGSRHGILCASTAAGPAFEAGAIRMGMRAVAGAISRVSYRNGKLQATVIGNGEALGICGSGLVDAVVTGLESGAILPSGRIANHTRVFPICEPVVLDQADIRELQLAKAAIASGFRLLLKRLGASVGDLQCIYLAGAFGNYVQIDSAIGIGLIEAPGSRVQAAGNTALRGAKELLLAAEEPTLPGITHVSLAADPSFQDEFVNCMTFPQVRSFIR